jgi:hypothetical protein
MQRTRNYRWFALTRTGTANVPDQGKLDILSHQFVVFDRWACGPGQRFRTGLGSSRDRYMSRKQRRRLDCTATARIRGSNTRHILTYPLRFRLRTDLANDRGSDMRCIPNRRGARFGHGDASMSVELHSHTGWGSNLAGCMLHRLSRRWGRTAKVCILG